MIRSLAFLLFLVSISFYTVHGKQKPLKEVMDGIEYRIKRLSRYMFSDKAFKNKKNEGVISGHLMGLKGYGKHLPEHPQIKAMGYHLSGKVFKQQITEADRLFKGGNKEFARHALVSSLSICMSCHTQLPSASRVRWDFPMRKNGDSFQRAELLYATWSFNIALSIYGKLLSKYPAQISSWQAEVALKRIVAYYARVKRDPKGGAARLKRVLRNKKLPEYLQDNIKAWIAAFDKWGKQPKFDVANANDAKIKKLIKTVLAPELGSNSWQKADNPKVVTYLRISGILFQYLQSHPKSQLTPEILLALAQAERRVNPNFFYSLADAYLKECIKKFPKSSPAKKCYQEYEDHVTMGYSGSGGINIPPDVKKELDSLKAMVN